MSRNLLSSNLFRTIILVNRGWIPTSLKDPSSRLEYNENGVQQIVGFVKKPVKKGSFIPENKVESGSWYWIDIPTMASLVNGIPILVDCVPKGGLNTNNYEMIEGTNEIRYPIPIGHQINFQLPNNHLQYVITWYSLSVALSVMSWIFLRKSQPKTRIFSGSIR